MQGLASERGLRYEPVGGLNPKGAPAALCPGGTNRITGELEPGFWGAACDADEREEGGFGRRAVLPGAILAKAHMPDLARVVPIFHVESIEFNRHFIATVPRDHDPIALRELFSPAFLDWTTRLPAEVDFGVTDRQLFFHWRLRELSREELEAALKGAGGIFEGLRREMAEDGLHTFKAGPWDAGTEPFPPAPGA